jgi:hypothetical protein
MLPRDTNVIRYYFCSSALLDGASPTIPDVQVAAHFVLFSGRSNLCIPDARPTLPDIPVLCRWSKSDMPETHF